MSPCGIYGVVEKNNTTKCQLFTPLAWRRTTMTVAAAVTAL